MSSPISFTSNAGSPYLSRIWLLAEELERQSQPRLAALYLTSVLLHPEDCGWEEERTHAISCPSLRLHSPAFSPRKAPAKDLTRPCFPPYCRREELLTRLKAASLLVEEVEKQSRGFQVAEVVPAERRTSMMEECMSLAGVLLAPLFTCCSRRLSWKGVEEMILDGAPVDEEDGKEGLAFHLGSATGDTCAEAIDCTPSSLSCSSSPLHSARMRWMTSQRQGNDVDAFQRRGNQLMHHATPPTPVYAEEVEEEEMFRHLTREQVVVQEMWSLLDEIKQKEKREMEDGVGNLLPGVLSRTGLACPSRALFASSMIDRSTPLGARLDVHTSSQDAMLQKAREPWDQSESEYFFHPLHMSTFNWRETCFALYIPSVLGEKCTPYQGLQGRAYTREKEKGTPSKRDEVDELVPRNSIDEEATPLQTTPPSGTAMRTCWVNTAKNTTPSMAKEEREETVRMGTQGKEGTPHTDNHATPMDALLFCWFHHSNCISRDVQQKKPIREEQRSSHGLPVSTISNISWRRQATTTPFALLLRAFLLLSRWYRLCGNLSAALEVLRVGKQRLQPWFSPFAGSSTISFREGWTPGVKWEEEKEQLLQQLEARCGGYFTLQDDVLVSGGSCWKESGKSGGSEADEGQTPVRSATQPERGMRSSAFFPSSLRKVWGDILDIFCSQERLSAQLLWESEYCSVLHSILQWLTSPNSYFLSACTSSSHDRGHHRRRNAEEAFKIARDRQVCLSQLMAHSSICFTVDERFRCWQGLWDFCAHDATSCGAGAEEGEGEDRHSTENPIFSWRSRRLPQARLCRPAIPLGNGTTPLHPQGTPPHRHLEELFCTDDTPQDFNTRSPLVAKEKQVKEEQNRGGCRWCGSPSIPLFPLQKWREKHVLDERPLPPEGEEKREDTKDTADALSPSRMPSTKRKRSEARRYAKVLLSALLLQLRGQLDASCLMSWSVALSPDGERGGAVVGKENTDIPSALHLIAFLHAYSLAVSHGVGQLHQVAAPYATWEWESDLHRRGHTTGGERPCMNVEDWVECGIRRCGEIGRRAGVRCPYPSLFSTLSCGIPGAPSFPSHSSFPFLTCRDTPHPQDQTPSLRLPQKAQGIKEKDEKGSSDSLSSETPPGWDGEEKAGEWVDEFTLVQQLWTLSSPWHHRGKCFTSHASTRAFTRTMTEGGRPVPEVVHKDYPTRSRHMAPETEVTSSHGNGIRHWTTPIWRRLLQRYNQFCTMATSLPSPAAALSSLNGTDFSFASSIAATSSSTRDAIENSDENERPCEGNSFFALVQWYMTLLKDMEKEVVRLSHNDTLRDAKEEEEDTPHPTEGATGERMESRRRGRHRTCPASGSDTAESTPAFGGDVSLLSYTSFCSPPACTSSFSSASHTVGQEWKRKRRSCQTSCDSSSLAGECRGEMKDVVLLASRKRRREQEIDEEDAHGAALFAYSGISLSNTLSFLFSLQSATHLIMAKTALRQRYPLTCLHCLLAWQTSQADSSPAWCTPMKGWGHVLKAILALHMGITEVSTSSRAMGLLPVSRSKWKTEHLSLSGSRGLPSSTLDVPQTRHRRYPDDDEAHLLECSSSRLPRWVEASSGEAGASHLLPGTRAEEEEEEVVEQELASIVGLPYYHLLIAESIARGEHHEAMILDLGEGKGIVPRPPRNWEAEEDFRFPPSRSLFTSSPSFLLQLQLLKLFAIYYTASPTRPRLIVSPAVASPAVRASDGAASSTKREKERIGTQHRQELGDNGAGENRGAKVVLVHQLKRQVEKEEEEGAERGAGVGSQAGTTPSRTAANDGIRRPRSGGDTRETEEKESKQEEERISVEKNTANTKGEGVMSFFHPMFTPTLGPSPTDAPASLLRSGALEVKVHAAFDLQQRCQRICRIKLDALLEQYAMICREESAEKSEEEEAIRTNEIQFTRSHNAMAAMPCNPTTGRCLTWKKGGRIPAEAWTRSNRSLLLLLHGLFAATEEHDPFLARKQWKRVLHLVQQRKGIQEKKEKNYLEAQGMAPHILPSSCFPLSGLKCRKIEETYSCAVPWEEDIQLLLCKISKTEAGGEEEQCITGCEGEDLKAAYSPVWGTTSAALQDGSGDPVGRHHHEQLCDGASPESREHLEMKHTESACAAVGTTACLHRCGSNSSDGAGSPQKGSRVLATPLAPFSTTRHVSSHKEVDDDVPSPALRRWKHTVFELCGGTLPSLPNTPLSSACETPSVNPGHPVTYPVRSDPSYVADWDASLAPRVDFFPSSGNSFHNDLSTITLDMLQQVLGSLPF